MSPHLQASPSHREQQCWKGTGGQSSKAWGGHHTSKAPDDGPCIFHLRPTICTAPVSFCMPSACALSPCTASSKGLLMAHHVLCRRHILHAAATELWSLMRVKPPPCAVVQRCEVLHWHVIGRPTQVTLVPPAAVWHPPGSRPQGPSLLHDLWLIAERIMTTGPAALGCSCLLPAQQHDYDWHSTVITAPKQAALVLPATRQSPMSGQDWHYCFRPATELQSAMLIVSKSHTGFIYSIATLYRTPHTCFQYCLQQYNGSPAIDQRCTSFRCRICLHRQHQVEHEPAELPSRWRPSHITEHWACLQHFCNEHSCLTQAHTHCLQLRLMEGITHCWQNSGSNMAASRCNTAVGM